VHPIAGQGLNMGLKDVAALAEVLVDARRLGEDYASTLVLERYARWRRIDAAGLAIASDLFTRLFSNDHPGLRLVRGLGLSLVNRVAPAKRLFVREAAGMLGDTPRLLRGEAL
jgi:2-octaprenyl-6-methoxyphenol hydroxylase